MAHKAAPSASIFSARPWQKPHSSLAALPSSGQLPCRQVGLRPPQGASLEQNRLSCKHSVVPERSVPQSVAGAPLAGSVPPAPAERPPKQVGRRSSVAERETHHKIRRYSPSRGKGTAILHLVSWQKNPESALRRF
ncbi:hypothetical protein ABLA30_22565 [Xenorhabdus nematophila]|uniref:hypothetical protein n=1 Tax=Xenorhabdus nematophila TaxID=628 RepID=UPI0032B702B4